MDRESYGDATARDTRGWGWTWGGGRFKESYEASIFGFVYLARTTNFSILNWHRQRWVLGFCWVIAPDRSLAFRSAFWWKWQKDLNGEILYCSF
ncbi:hypothetical protein CDAR_413501 [Caerostris darwini]|uniref:Uncharacterized protein n=1 Tax=Caerostris darwini TaxID=1538125 RepID=A0AAV4S5S6_9ARAC|nr:hypothetical protein CDAR_413501 [Caerostris darwini]